ncbi:MAG: pantetheine-phosphate adenylyltransferase [Lentimicrobiaceae bacterium]|jgi:pantetheine-phosphate adenylyltransferase|nr:pantetheine-phosphate adenylyltransferase [Lentimicrobiaceae bacterium]
MKKAVFPGSFDPITRGHESLVRRAANLFDEIVIAVGINATKNSFFSLEKRLQWIRETFADLQKIRVTSYKGLTVDFCKSIDAQYIIRGIRNANDLAFESEIGQANKVLVPDIETVFLLTTSEYNFISSSIIRDVFRNGGNTRPFIPENIKLTI